MLEGSPVFAGSLHPVEGRNVMPASSVPEPPERPRRVFKRETTHPGRRRLRDLDAAQRALFIRAVTWGGIPGGVLGGFLAWFLTLGRPAPIPALGIFAGAVLVGTLTTLFPILMAGAAGRAALIALGSSGHTPPRKKEYSFAQSLAARGLFEKAIAAYEEAVHGDPGDPEPYLRIGRIYRDELDRPDDAARWFRRARRDAGMTPGQDLFVSRELVELYRNRLRRPGKALPELARMAETFAGTPDGEWAARELEALKAEMAKKGRGGQEAGVDPARP
jgi:tetratricopeptide (TPR) repeat protein